jgi:hypothetical protein
VKRLSSIFVLVLFAAPSALAQKPVPPGIRQADTTEAQTQSNIPPPASPRAHVDMVQLRQEADELARIAQTIPPDIAAVQNGILPKDVIEKLKRVEKLSKNLRSAISH